MYKIAGDDSAGFFKKFSFGSLKLIFAGAKLSFGNGPDSHVLFGPERAAVMDEKNLQVGLVTKKQDASAIFSEGGRRHSLILLFLWSFWVSYINIATRIVIDLLETVNLKF